MTAPDDRLRRAAGKIGDVWLPVNDERPVALPGWSGGGLALLILASLGVITALARWLI